jgi:hypothetical protein
VASLHRYSYIFAVIVPETALPSACSPRSCHLVALHQDPILLSSIPDKGRLHPCICACPSCRCLSRLLTLDRALHTIQGNCAHVPFPRLEIFKEGSEAATPLPEIDTYESGASPAEERRPCGRTRLEIQKKCDDSARLLPGLVGRGGLPPHQDRGVRRDLRPGQFEAMASGVMPPRSRGFENSNLLRRICTQIYTDIK